MIGGCARAFCALIILIGCSCTGEVDVIHDADGNEWTPGAFTYNQLVRSTQQGTGGNHIVDWNDSVEVQPDRIASRFSLQEQLKVVTVSKAQLGDLDFVSKALKKKRGEFIVTVEATGGAVLASIPMNKQEIITGDQLKKKDVKQETTVAAKIEVPPELAGPGTNFRGGLFACIDADRDGSCADEVVNRLDSDKASQNVIFFAGLKGSVKGQGTARTTELYHATASEVGSPDWIMVQVLKNLPSESGQGPLTVTLAVGVIGDKVKGLGQSGPEISPEELVKIHKAQLPKHKKRTNGCFVRGTRILLAGGEMLRVEDVFTGVQVTTAAGRRLEVLESVAGPERHPVVAIKTDGGHSLRVTRSHPMLTPSGLRMADRLSVGDRLVAADRSVVKITSLKREPYGDLVFNFSLPGELETDHLVNAEGLITGDLHLQQKLAE